MDWLVALLSVALGAAGTYFIQSRQQKMQRDWNLDDQRRHWERERLKRLSDQLSELMAILNKIFSGFYEKSEEGFDEYKSEYIDKASKLGADVDVAFDGELNDLFDRFMEISSLASTKTQIEVKGAYKKVQRRISTLYDGSFL